MHIPSILVGELYARGRPKRREFHNAWSFGAKTVLELLALPRESEVEYRLTKTVAGLKRDEVKGKVDVSWTHLNLGGRRAWLHCTRSGCRRRTTRLYLDAPWLVCRVCAGIRYASKNQPKHERTRLRADKLRLRLGGEPGHNAPVPSKPLGMHWTTYVRLRSDLADAEAVWHQHVRTVIADNRRFFAVVSSASVAEAPQSLPALIARLLREKRNERQSLTAGE